MAQLVIDGKSYGLHAFLVPLRSMTTHQPFAGVLIGDLGHKIGQNGLDNGFVAFTHYRIPREYLLNSFADVTPDGRYTAEHIAPGRRFAMVMQVNE